MKKKFAMLAVCLVMAVVAMAERQTVQIRIPEMECGTCQAKVEKVLAYEKGVKDIKYDIKKRTVTVVYEDKQTSPEKLQEALLKDLKYKSTIIAPKTEKEVDATNAAKPQEEKKGCSATCGGNHH